MTNFSEMSAMNETKETFIININNREYTIVEQYDPEIDYAVRQYFVDEEEIAKELIAPDVITEIDDAIDTMAA